MAMPAASETIALVSFGFALSLAPTYSLAATFATPFARREMVL